MLAALRAAAPGAWLVAISLSTLSSPLRCEAVDSHCGNEAKYCARSSVSKLTPGGVRHSSMVSRRASASSSRSISRNSPSTGPRRPMRPGPASHNDPLMRRSLTTRSGCSTGILLIAKEDRRDPRNRLEVVHADFRVGNRSANLLLGKGDELEYPQGIEEPARE